MLEEKEYPKVIKELEEFRDMIIKYFDLEPKGPYDSVSDKDQKALNQLRQEINQRSSVIKYYFDEVNEGYVLYGRAPAVVGTYPFATNIFDNLFDEGSFAIMGTDKVIDML